MGVFSAITDLLGGIIDNFAEDSRQQLNREWQTSEREAMQDYQTSERESQNQWNLDQWNRENEYNSPMMQLQRLKDAGLNPNMMFGGSGDIATASALQGSSGSAPSDPTPASYPLQSRFGDTVAHTIQNLILEEDLKRKKMENGNYQEITDAEIAEMKANAYKSYQDGKLTSQEFKLQSTIFDNLVQKSNFDVQIAEQEINQLRAQTRLIESQVNLTDKEAETEDARKTNIESDTKVKDQETLKLEWENLFRDQFGIDPHSSGLQMLIQGLLSGDEKANKFLNQLLSTIKGIFGIEDDDDSYGGDRTPLPRYNRTPRAPKMSHRDRKPASWNPNYKNDN